jgi:hypothetical protein
MRVNAKIACVRFRTDGKYKSEIYFTFSPSARNMPA